MGPYTIVIALTLICVFVTCVSGTIVNSANYTECIPFACQHKANCTINKRPHPEVDLLDKCICTPGFTSTHCESNMMEEIQTNVVAGVLVETKFEYVFNQTEHVILALNDQMDQRYELIFRSVQIIPSIMTALAGLGDTIDIKKDDTTIDQVGQRYIYLMRYVHYYCDELRCSTINGTAAGCINTSMEAQALVMDSETATIDMLKLMLLHDKSKSRYDLYTYDQVSVAVAREKKGDELPTEIVAKYGKFLMPYWETFQEAIKGKETNVIVLTYQNSPYIFANNTNAINTGIVKMVIIDKKGKDIALPDPEDPIGLRAEAKNALNTGVIWKYMEPSKTTVGGFNAIVAFNYSIAGFTFDINYESMKTCVTLGKFGPDAFPTEDDFDIRVETKGLNKVVSSLPKTLIMSFDAQVLQIAHTYTAEGEALLKPILMVVSCGELLPANDFSGLLKSGLTMFCEHKIMTAVVFVEGGGGSRRRREAVTTPSPSLARPHRYRIVEVDLRKFDVLTSTWKVSENIKLASGTGTNIAYQSNFFGTFSADVMFVAPETINFKDIFLNFAEKLAETPHALACIIGLWFIAVLITIPLRRLDRSDAILWSYLPLEDNAPGSKHKYYVAVSTGIRSPRQLTSTVYVKVIGDKGDTGIRQLSDGQRKNFVRGTTSHFVMKTADDLGHLQKLIVWHNNEGSSPAWLLSKIVIGDISNERRYVFICGKWLSIGGEDGKTWKTIEALNETVMDSQLLLNEASKRNMFDDNLWFSLSKRPNYSRFTRVQRLWSVTALLFLSMVASAMFYRTQDDEGRVLALGPFKFSSKQFSVGFMSAAVAVVPSIIIINIFKNRRFKGEQNIQMHSDEDGAPQKKKCFCVRCCSMPTSLPWWTIFIGYMLILACIVSGGFFTFMYSLVWGKDVTVEWLLSFFIGTVESVLIFEPVKAIGLAIILAFCCSRNARSTLADLPLPSEEEHKEDDGNTGSASSENPTDCALSIVSRG